MTSRPVIFISAVSKELKSARDLVAKTLLSLGYEPKWQDIAPAETGDLRGVLRKWVDDSRAVIQLVGHCYGTGPRALDPDFGRVSYTQYEALYARQRGKKIWYFFVGERFMPDPHEPEPEELRQLQQQYWEQVRATGDLRRSFASAVALETSVLRLRDDLTHLRRRGKQWAALVLGLLVLLTAGALWLIKGQQRLLGEQQQTQKSAERTDAKVTAVIERYQKMEQALVRLADVEMNAKQLGEKLTPAELRQRAYTILENELGIPAGSLAKDLPAFALELYGRPDASLLMRAHAAFALNKYEEAEKLFLRSAAQDAKAAADAPDAAERLRGRRIEAIEGAGESALLQLQYRRSLAHHEAAAALADREREPLEWARLHHKLSFVLGEVGDHREAAHLLPSVIEIKQRILGPEDPDTLSSRNSFANALEALGRLDEAEAEHRAVMAIRERLFGPEHLDTLGSRNNLALILHTRHEYARAETEHRAIIAIRERTQGPEHPDTLSARNNLAVALRGQDKFDEAEAEHRAVLVIRARFIGPEHPETLGTRNSLALLLSDRGRHAEAEAEYRALIAINERVQGPEHRDTLMNRSNLATALRAQGRYAEAEAQQRITLEAKERVLGPAHHSTVKSRMGLAITLATRQQFAEAEGLFRAVLEDQRRILGPEHPDTLASMVNHASVLNDLDRHAEAAEEFRTLLPLMERILGPQHSSTLRARGNFASLLERQGRYAESESEHRAVLKIQERVPGSERLDVFRTCRNLAIALDAQGKKDEALAFARRAWEGHKKLLGAQHPATQDVRATLDALEAK